MENSINVEVVLIQRNQQNILSLQVPANSTIKYVLCEANLLAEEMDKLVVGIFGKIRHLDFTVSDGDRIEIYRPLINDPKIARATKVQLERRAMRMQKQKKSTTSA